MLELDSTPSSGPSRYDSKDKPNTHYIDPSFHDNLKKISTFKLSFSFKHNYRVIVPSPTDIMMNSHPGCIMVYLESLKHDL